MRCRLSATVASCREPTVSIHIWARVGAWSAGSVFNNVEKTERAQWKQRLEAHMDGVACSTFVFLVTLWALFGDDLRLVCTPKEADEYFVIAAIVSLFVFSIELGTAPASAAASLRPPRPSLPLYGSVMSLGACRR